MHLATFEIIRHLVFVLVVIGHLAATKSFLLCHKLLGTLSDLIFFCLQPAQLLPKIPVHLLCVCAHRHLLPLRHMPTKSTKRRANMRETYIKRWNSLGGLNSKLGLLLHSW